VVFGRDEGESWIGRCRDDVLGEDQLIWGVVPSDPRGGASSNGCTRGSRTNGDERAKVRCPISGYGNGKGDEVGRHQHVGEGA
jgi:hypothetical protein